MKSLSNKISFSRISFLLKKEFFESRKIFTLRALILVAIFTSISLLVGMNNTDHYNSITESVKNSPTGKYISTSYISDDDLTPSGVPIDNATESLFAIFMFAMPVVIAVSTSLTFERMSNKRKKISFLMTPATTLEKYITQVLIYSVGTFLLTASAFFIADIVRYILFTMAYPNYGVIQTIPYTKYIAKAFSEPLFNNPLLIYLSSIALTGSIYTLGSSVWPRLSFIKTFGFMSALGFTFLFTAITFGNSKSLLLSFDSDLVTNLICSLLYIAPIINYTLAYFRFKESEIIQRM